HWIETRIGNLLWPGTIGRQNRPRKTINDERGQNKKRRPSCVRVVEERQVANRSTRPYISHDGDRRSWRHSTVYREVQPQRPERRPESNPTEPRRSSRRQT